MRRVRMARKEAEEETEENVMPLSSSNDGIQGIFVSEAGRLRKDKELGGMHEKLV